MAPWFDGAMIYTYCADAVYRRVGASTVSSEGDPRFADCRAPEKKHPREFD
jgi:hypothetical protein